MSPPDLETLYLRFIDGGDAQAFAELFDRAEPDLRDFAVRLAGDRDAADDLLQETFLTAIQKQESWKRRQPVMPWLIGVLMHRARNERRQEARRPEIDRLQQRVVQPPDERVADAEVRRTVTAAIAELPGGLRAVVEPKLLTGARSKDLAVELGITAAAARKRLHRGLQRLRAALPAGFVVGTGAGSGRGSGGGKHSVTAEFLEDVGVEVIALLQEIAEDPRSRILRPARDRELRGVASGRDISFQSTVGLTKAEKRLISGYREEAAYVLRLAHYLLVDLQPVERRKGVFRCRHRAAQGGYPVDDDYIPEEDDSFDSCDAAAKEIDGEFSFLTRRVETLRDLPIASLRIAPSPSARSYVGNEHTMDGDFASAERVYRCLTEEDLPSRVAADMLGALGMALALQGRRAEARECHRKVVESFPCRDASAFNWLSMSVQTGCIDQALESAKAADETHRVMPWRLDEYLEGIAYQRAIGMWSPTVEAPRAIKSVESVAGPASGRIVEAAGR